MTIFGWHVDCQLCIKINQNKSSFCLISLFFFPFRQNSTRGEIEIIQCRDLLKDASQTRAQLQLWSSQWGQCPEGQHGWVPGYINIFTCKKTYMNVTLKAFVFFRSRQPSELRTPPFGRRKGSKSERHGGRSAGRRGRRLFGWQVSVQKLSMRHKPKGRKSPVTFWHTTFHQTGIQIFKTL